MRILIVKTSSLGDIIQSFPVVSFLRKTFPHAQIDWAAESSFKDLLEAFSEIDRVILFDTREWRKNLLRDWKKITLAARDLRRTSYDLLIDLQGNIKSGIITRCALAKEKIGTTFSSASEWPSALFLTRRYSLNKKDPISLQYLSIVQRYFAIEPYAISPKLTLKISKDEEQWIASQLQVAARIMVCPGSRWENKKLYLTTWIEILKEIREKRGAHFYFVWGSPKEEQEALALHAQFPNHSTILPQMRLPLWQRMMSYMDEILTVDSSALHLAATTGVPTYSFFGPSSALVYKPIGDHHKAFQGSCPYGKTFLKRCPALRVCKTGACLKTQGVNHLYSKEDQKNL